MTRNLKILAAAFAAALALIAITATAASAEGKFTCSVYPCKATGQSILGNSVLTTEGGTMECKTHYEASLAEASSSLAVTFSISDCRAFGFVSGTVVTNGCHHLFTTPSKVGNHVWTSTEHLVCPSGKVLEISASNCKLTLGPQTPGGHLIIDNTTAATPDDVDIQGTFTNINYTVTQDGFLCPFNGAGAKTGATFVHKSLVTISSTNGASIHVG
jgi:hypothetical protein